MKPIDRRDWFGVAFGAAATATMATAAPAKKALVSITLDLEMSRNFPTWETTHWDYEKGNLDDATKKYAVEAARRVKKDGGVLHFFAVGRVLEQADVGWLAEIAKDGHPIGNHTYDHVNVTAAKPEDLQLRFQRAPWLLRGQTVAEAIRDNVELCTKALKQRLDIAPAGFRTPGGFADGLRTHPRIRAMLKDLGFEWVSSLYPPHSAAIANREPDEEFLKGLVAAMPKAQPFAYPNGLVEVPMSPISDIGAFRTGRWKLEWFLRAVRRCVEWTIERGAVFDFLGHPSCLHVVDPEFKTIDLICDLVRRAGEKAAIVDLGTLAKRASD
jgi:peptidoglycan/xylan/chitin deacetylase (PgdA/CDA1 family)